MQHHKIGREGLTISSWLHVIKELYPWWMIYMPPSAYNSGWLEENTGQCPRHRKRTPWVSTSKHALSESIKSVLYLSSTYCNAAFISTHSVNVKPTACQTVIQIPLFIGNIGLADRRTTPWLWLPFWCISLKRSAIFLKLLHSLRNKASSKSLDCGLEPTIRHSHIKWIHPWFCMKPILKWFFPESSLKSSIELSVCSQTVEAPMHCLACQWSDFMSVFPH